VAIVVSHIADTFDELARRALRQAPLADLIELRLDRIGHPGKAPLAALCAEAGKPVIVACPGPEAYGTFAGSVDERLGLFHDAAEAGARFVDVDWRLSLELGEVQPPCHRIVSRHELDGTPAEVAELDALLEDVQEVLYEGDVTKLVTHARSCEDGLLLLSWLRTTKGVVSFCAGEAGAFTRVLAPIFGSPFTYCAPASVPGEADGEATAPGQIRVGDLRGVLPPGGISQETAVFGVVGRPVSGSLSPWVHGMALKAARLDAVYVAFEPETLEGFLALADDENYRGFSVTAPFKRAAHAATERRDEGARRSGSANTLVRDPEGWRAFDTDATAVRETLEQALRLHGSVAGRPVALQVAHALVLGTGGAARAAAWAVRSVGGRVTVAGRRAEAASALAAELDAQAVAWDAIPETEHDVLVHATPVGSEGGADELVIPAEWIRPETLVLDAVYRPIRTPLLVAAHARGCTPVPGGEWFVRQAIAQFKLFTQHDPDEDLMRKAFEHAED
jgi:3-dehydroquinate dehydratase/shikimate dehydrogenase